VNEAREPVADARDGARMPWNAWPSSSRVEAETVTGCLTVGMAASFL
jgi:hypothetical protein